MNTSSTVRLSDTQVAALQGMSDNAGFAVCPGGYTTAGADASRWWRTMRVLERHGFVRRSGEQSYELQPEGFDALVKAKGGVCPRCRQTDCCRCAEKFEVLPKPRKPLGPSKSEREEP